MVTDAVGRLIRRSARAGLYRELTAGLDPAVNEATYPVISGLARTGPATAAFARSLHRFTEHGPWATAD